MTHAKLMDATKALEEALKEQEKWRLLWVISYAVDRDRRFMEYFAITEHYAEACGAAANAQTAYDAALSIAQAEAIWEERTA